MEHLKKYFSSYVPEIQSLLMKSVDISTAIQEK